jgi:GntR family transcriptional regulator/MocR family aminotransferase
MTRTTIDGTRALFTPGAVTRAMRTVSANGHTPAIPFDPASGVPYYTQIYNGYRTAILSGRLSPGQRLPSTRTLAEEFHISRFPVLSAFDQLLQDGYLVGKVGSGTFVRDPVPDELSKPIAGRLPSPRALPSIDQGPLPGESLGLFTVGLPALDRFPHRVFSRLVRHHASVGSPQLLAYGDPAGYPPLREAITDYLRTARAVDCDPSQVLIVTGSQMALVISAIALTTPESTVCVEEPGYPGAQLALAMGGANIIRVGVDEDGIDVTAIRQVPDPINVVYVTPSHQFPLGASLEMVRRIELLSWAARRHAWIVEDDYDSEYRYSMRPLGALQGMDADERVIYVGTFSQALFPALRIGYMVVPRALVSEFVRIREGLDICPPTLFQLVLTDFLNQGHFARHLRRMRSIYLARRDALISAIQRHAADVLMLCNTDAGTHLVALLPNDVDDREVVRRAAEHRMYPKALSTCYATTGASTGLILGYGGSDECALTRGVQVLAEIIRELR